MSTSSRANQARNGQGKWVRQVTSAERDGQAAKLAAQGWSYDRIALELGYSGRGDAHRGARRAMAELAEMHGAGELRRQQVESNRLLREKLWRVVESPPPLVSRTGKVVVDEATGEQIPDAQALVAAATAILKCDERIARLAGLDAPRRSVSMSLEEALDEARRAAAAEYGYDVDEVDAGEAFRRWLEDGARLDLGKLHLPPVAELPEDQQAIVRELIAESAERAKQRVVVGQLVRQRKPIGSGQ